MSRQTDFHPAEGHVGAHLLAGLLGQVDLLPVLLEVLGVHVELEDQGLRRVDSRARPVLWAASHGPVIAQGPRLGGGPTGTERPSWTAALVTRARRFVLAGHARVGDSEGGAPPRAGAAAGGGARAVEARCCTRQMAVSTAGCSGERGGVSSARGPESRTHLEIFPRGVHGASLAPGDRLRPPRTRVVGSPTAPAPSLATVAEKGQSIRVPSACLVDFQLCDAACLNKIGYPVIPHCL